MIDEYVSRNSAKIGAKGATSEGSVQFRTDLLRLRPAELRLLAKFRIPLPAVAEILLIYKGENFQCKISQSVLHWSSLKKELELAEEGTGARWRRNWSSLKKELELA